MNKCKLLFTFFSIGPKGVINDWRRFKLESMDQDNLPPAKKELLRQMSSPHKASDDPRSNVNRKVEPTQDFYFGGEQILFDSDPRTVCL